MRKLFVGLAAALGIGAAVTIASARDITVAAAIVQAETATLVASWKASSSTIAGCPQYRVTWTVGGVPTAGKTVTVLADTIRVTRAAGAATVTASASVVAVCGSTQSAARSASRTITWPVVTLPVDSTPSPVDSLRIDTARVVVVPPPDTTTPPTTGSWDLASQLPAGLTKRADTQHETLVPSGWPGYATRMGAQPSLLTNAGAPLNDATAMRQTWTGVIDGESPHYLWWPTQSTHLYVATIVRISSAMMPPNEVKWITFNPGNGFAWIGFYREGNAHEMRFVRRGSRDYYAGRVGAVRPLPTDQWAKVQLEVRINPTRVRLWINDVLTMSESGVLPSTFPAFSWDGMTSFGELQLGSTWGGGNGVTAPANATIDYARTAIWTN